MNAEKQKVYLSYLEQHLEQIKFALKPDKLHLNSNYLYDSHWSLILGQEASGKTSLLNQTNLHLCQAISEDNTECNSWFNQQRVLIEYPQNLDDKNFSLLKGIINCLKKVRARRPLDHLLLCIDLTQMVNIDHQEFDSHLSILKKQISTINTYFVSPPPLYISFTQMDKIAGFCDYFNDAPQFNHLQTCGYSFEYYNNKATLLEQNNEKYTQFLNTIHQHLLSRLHATRNSLKKSLIREFPLQMESLQHIIQSIISKLYCDNGFINGLFFNSAKQGNNAHDYLSAPIGSSYDLTVKSTMPQASKSTSSFVTGFIDEMTDTGIQSRVSNLPKKSMLGFGASTILLCALFGHQYLHSNQILEQAEQQLIRYQEVSQNSEFSSSNLSALFPSLHYLSNASETLSELQIAWLSPFRNMKRIQSATSKQYYWHLQQQLLPAIAEQIEARLSNNQRLDPVTTYESLKAYLMLAGSEHLDRKYLHNYFKKAWANHYSATQISQQIELLQQALREPFQGIKLNAAVINYSRSYLAGLPRHYLYYLIIKPQIMSEMTEAGLPLNKQQKIPYVYTKQGFLNTYDHSLSKITQQLFSEEWVLNNNSEPETHLQILSGVKKIYLSNYANWWRLFSERGRGSNFTNYQQAIQALTQQASKQSPLSTLVHLIQLNTRSYTNPKSPIEILFNQQISSQFTEINLITKNTLKSYQAMLNDLNLYLNTLSNSSDVEKSAFKIARTRFLQNENNDPISQILKASVHLPSPINLWFKQIAGNAWYLILNDAQNEIKRQWTTHIYPSYQQQIEDRYPFTVTADRDVELEEFSSFFSKDGQLNQFFDEYIEPFLNTDTANWKTKSIDGLSLPLNSEVITEFERANVIREMFFSSNADKPTLHFQLRSIALEPVISKLILSINGETLLDYQGAQKNAQFNWPGKSQQNDASLFIRNINGENYQLKEKGLWGTFKLFQKGDLSLIDPQDTKNYQLILDINGNAAKYLLTADKAVNPFLPHILDSFVLPKAIL